MVKAVTGGAVGIALAAGALWASPLMTTEANACQSVEVRTVGSTGVPKWLVDRTQVAANRIVHDVLKIPLGADCNVKVALTWIPPTPDLELQERRYGWPEARRGKLGAIEGSATLTSSRGRISSARTDFQHGIAALASDLVSPLFEDEIGEMENSGLSDRVAEVLCTEQTHNLSLPILEPSREIIYIPPDDEFDPCGAVFCESIFTSGLFDSVIVQISREMIEYYEISYGKGIAEAIYRRIMQRDLKADRPLTEGWWRLTATPATSSYGNLPMRAVPIEEPRSGTVIHASRTTLVVKTKDGRRELGTVYGLLVKTRYPGRDEVAFERKDVLLGVSFPRTCDSNFVNSASLVAINNAVIRDGGR